MDFEENGVKGNRGWGSYDTDNELSYRKLIRVVPDRKCASCEDVVIEVAGVSDTVPAKSETRTAAHTVRSQSPKPGEREDRRIRKIVLMLMLMLARAMSV